MSKNTFKKLIDITIGTDPEEFLEDLNGNIVSAEGKLGGTKDEPKKLTKLGHAVQEDNVMAEYNIPPVTGEDEFVREIGIAKNLIEEEVLKKQYKLVAKPSAELRPEEIYTEQAMTIGCEPDFNVYKEDVNDVPDLMENPFVRYCGGHIHIGTSTKMSDKDKMQLIKFMDAFVGCTSSLIDDDERRKGIYGQLGRMRFTEYGVKNIPLSSFIK